MNGRLRFVEVLLVVTVMVLLLPTTAFADPKEDIPFSPSDEYRAELGDIL